MRISVSEWTALRIALRLPRAVMNPEALAKSIGETAFTRRGIAAGILLLLAILVLLHIKASDSGVRRLVDINAQLTAVRSIDARWEAAVAQARIEYGAAKAAAVQETDAARIQHAMEAASAAAKTNAVRTSVEELRKAYVEKADIVARLQRAGADSRAALEAIMRSDQAVLNLVRDAWRDFPQRDRLVAAENLALRVLSDAQQYHLNPAPAHRASLESLATDLPKASSLPKSVQSGLARLETDLHRLLLLKPLEQVLAERIPALDTTRRAAELSAFYERALGEALVSRERWRNVLIIYTLILAVLAVYGVLRAIARFHDLEQLYAGQTRELAKALQRLRALETRAEPEDQIQSLRTRKSL